METSTGTTEASPVSPRGSLASMWPRLAAVLISTILLTSCGTPLPTYRYRLTVTAQTPEGVRQGSSVIEVRTTEVGKHALPQDRGLRKHVEGEAVVVDLGQRGLLVAMLRDRSGQGWPAFVLHSLLRPPASPMGETDRQHFDRVLALRGLHDLPRVTGTGATRMDNYPVLLRFPADGATVGAAPVNPDALAAAFGPGVALTRITIEPTDAPITRRIRKRLTWLSDDEKRLGAKFRANPRTADLGLGTMDFDRDL